MAVMQTPHGRVVGLIVRNDDQPAPKAIEKNQEKADIKPEAQQVKRSRTSRK